MVCSSKSSLNQELTSHVSLKRILLSVYRHNLHWTLIKRNGLVLRTVASEIHHLQTRKGHLAPSLAFLSTKLLTRIPWWQTKRFGPYSCEYAACKLAPPREHCKFDQIRRTTWTDDPKSLLRGPSLDWCRTPVIKV